MKILCVGQLVTDIIAAYVDYTHLDKDTRRVDQIVVKNGGDSMNTAINLAKLGCDVNFAGKIGNDSFGSFLRSVFEENNIDIRGLKITDKASTASVIVLVNEQGQRVFLYCGGANDTFCFNDIDLSLLDDCSHVHVGGTYLLPKFDGDGCARLFAAARGKGKTTSMDVTWDTTNRWLSVIEPCLPYLDLFMPSEAEARQITDADEPEQMAAFLQERGVKTVVIKLGERGAYIKDGGEGLYQPAYPTNVVDTTGAGDAFVAGFLSQYTKRSPLTECASFAVAVAAHCIREVGATGGVPDEATVKNLIKNFK